MRIQRPRLLIIDDDVDFRNLLNNTLRDQFFVSMAGEGCEGYSRAVTNRPDVIVLDLQMPGWDGLQTLSTLRDNPRLRDVPVLILSGDNSRESALAVIGAGADGYLLKENYSKSVLIERLNALVGVEAEIEE